MAEPTYDAPSSDSRLLLFNRLPTQSSPTPVILIVIPRRLGSHRPGRPLPLPFGPPPPPGASVYSPPPLRTFPWQGGSHSEPVRVWICYICHSKVGGGYPPPLPLSFAVCGSERSVSGGCSKSRPSSDIPLRGVTLLYLIPWGSVGGN